MTPPPVAVTVIVEVPVGVVERVSMVSVVVQVGVQDVLENEAVASVGRSETEKETEVAVPVASVAVMVLETDDPWVTVLLPEFPREKSKASMSGFTVRLNMVDRVTPPLVAVTVMG